MNETNWIFVGDEMPDTGYGPFYGSLNVLVWTNKCVDSDDVRIGGTTCKGTWCVEDMDDDEFVTHWAHITTPALTISEIRRIADMTDV
jgi:hypothetical protein